MGHHRSQEENDQEFYFNARRAQRERIESELLPKSKITHEDLARWSKARIFELHAGGMKERKAKKVAEREFLQKFGHKL